MVHLCPASAQPPLSNSGLLVVVVLAEAHHVASPFFLATWEVDILQLAQGLQHQIQSFLDHPGHRRRLHIWVEI